MKPITTVTELIEAMGTKFDADQKVTVITRVTKSGNETAEVPASEACVMANSMEFDGSLYSKEAATARKYALEQMGVEDRTHFMSLSKRFEIEATRQNKAADQITKLEASFPLAPDAENLITQAQIADMEDEDFASEIMAGAPQTVVDGFCEALDAAGESWNDIKAKNGFLPRNRHMEELEKYLRELKGSPHARQVMVELSYTNRETSERTYGYFVAPWNLRKEAVAIGNKANTDTHSIWCSGYRSVAAVKLDADYQQDLNAELADRDPAAASAAKERKQQIISSNDGMTADLETMMGQNANKLRRKAKFNRPLKQSLAGKLNAAINTDGDAVTG